MKSSPAAAFEVVKSGGLSLPGVAAGTKHDGSAVLRAGGCFMAGLATHPSAEPDSLVVRIDVDELSVSHRLALAKSRRRRTR